MFHCLRYCCFSVDFDQPVSRFHIGSIVCMKADVSKSIVYMVRNVRYWPTSQTFIYELVQMDRHNLILVDIDEDDLILFTVH